MRALAILLMAASGFAGLGYQIVWTQQSALWTGHEAASVLAIVAAFFGGLGLGAWWLSRRIDASLYAARWYGACEAVIGCWGLTLTLLMAPAANGLLGLIGPQPSAAWQWLVTFGGTFLLLLPATAAMGATLPALERMLRAVRFHYTSVAVLYAANTAGAVLGVLAAAFILVPRFGLQATAACCALLNLLCAAIAWRWRGLRTEPAELAAQARSRPLLTLALTGFLGIGFEVLVVRALSQVAENTVFTFAILLAIYLLGTALGAAWQAQRKHGNSLDSAGLLRWQALACLSSMLALALATPLKLSIIEALGASLQVALLAETVLALAAFFLPTLVMGALFSHLATQARDQGSGVGRSIGVNTLAAACAPLVFGLWLLPALGSTAAMLAVCVSYLLASGATRWARPLPLAAAGACLAMIAWHPPLAAIEVPPGGRLLSQVEGVSATVSVVEDAQGTATLHINNRQQEGSSSTGFSDARQAAIPLQLHPGARSALFLGLGTGATARAAARDASLRVDAVELLPEVIAAAGWFARRQDADPTPGLRVLAADARRYVRSAAEHYDVIVSDNFHPARSGSASLYTVEHFQAVRARLTTGGVFCQWLPLHQLDLDTLRSIVRSYQAVYPRTWMVLATHSLDTPVIGLVARRDAQAFPDQEDLALLGSFIAGPESLRQFAGIAALNTDDHPIVAWLAPRVTYEPQDLPRTRLLTLLASTTIESGELVEHSAPEIAARLTAYWRARDRYLAVGAAVQPSRNLHDMLGQVREPLLAVLAISPDFRPAYDPLIIMARDLANTEPHEARRLLESLLQASPRWSEARDALAELASGQP